MNNYEDNLPPPKNRFTGYFIPVELIEMEELSWSERILLVMIDGLYDKERGGCYASNQYLADKMNLKEPTVRGMLTHLKEIFLIEQVSFNGRNRVIRACKEKWLSKNDYEHQADCWKTIRQTDEKSSGRLMKKSQPSQEAHTYRRKEEDIKEDTQKATSVAGSELALGVCFFYCEAMKRANPAFREPDDINGWMNHFEVMIAKEGHSASDIEAVITYIEDELKAGNGFWISRIATPANFRRNYGSVYNQMVASKVKAARVTPQQAKEESQRSAAAIAKDNREWTESQVSKLKYNGISVNNHIIVSDFHVSLRIGNSWSPMPYNEPGFRDIVQSYIYKLDSYGNSDTVQRAYAAANTSRGA